MKTVKEFIHEASAPKDLPKIAYKDLKRGEHLSTILGDAYDPKARYTVRKEPIIRGRVAVAIVETASEGELFLHKDA